VTEIACTVCQQPLTGGLDTYGNYSEEVCFACYFGISDAGCELDDLRAEIAGLEIEIQELEQQQEVVDHYRIEAFGEDDDEEAGWDEEHHLNSLELAMLNRHLQDALDRLEDLERIEVAVLV
jgi:hypothetical protein